LEEELRAAIACMREDMRAQDVGRDHNDPARCRACGYAEVCDQSLA
jgi:CRISPR/Cas system-associated exonuclease Cas4 (RecB family)